MSSHRAFFRLAVAASAIVLFACGDYTRATSPALSQAKLVAVRTPFSLVEGGSKARAVRWGPAHSRVEQTASAVIGPEGGTVSLPGSDFTMNIPSGALSAPTTITIVSKAGSHVAYEMLPHGLQFLRPVTAIQGLQNTATYGTNDGNAVRTAYLPEGRDTIDDDDSAAPSELEAATTYYGATGAESHVWIINHFSRYILISNVWVLVGG
ncbi:MAG TPA: hypothetical protein VHT23_01455 [Gemmatimonadaceae bacterium]|jgi:hypothetical protein|nr:hypothetical protein [Gemmatimonadaceae bacterium]